MDWQWVDTGMNKIAQRTKAFGFVVVGHRKGWTRVIGIHTGTEYFVDIEDIERTAPGTVVHKHDLNKKSRICMVSNEKESVHFKEP